MPIEKLIKTKTGAVICKKPVSGSHLMEFEALLFITGIPVEITDEQLKKSLNNILKEVSGKDCVEILVRADINSTSNEISEQFKGLNNDSAKATFISFVNI